MHNYLKTFLKEQSGSIAPIFATTVIPVMILAGAATDYAAQSKNSAHVSSAADAALLSVANRARSVISNAEDNEQLKTGVKALLDPELTASLSQYTGMAYEIDTVQYNEPTSELKVDIKMTQGTSFLELANIDKLETTISTAVTLGGPTKNALSVAFVLDKSGSMGWYGRWSTLGTAMNSLKTKFNELDPDKKYIRTGLTMFDSSGYSFYGMKWNMQKIVNKLGAYWPGGGTNSSSAMINAYNYLNRNFEENKHKKRNDSDVRKVIIFMTDGVNSRVSYDTSTVNTCTAAKAAGIEVYAISFGAYGRGKTMLQNCSSGSAFFISANNNAQLIDAFDMIGESIGTEFYLSN